VTRLTAIGRHEGDLPGIARTRNELEMTATVVHRIEDGKLAKLYPFANYYQTMAFVNALAWISHREDHHPDLEVGYNKCRVQYATHAIGGLSENDFICAAKADALFQL